MTQSGIVVLDIHGLKVNQAGTLIESQIKRAGRGVYRIRIIHGYRGGTALRDMVRSRFAGYPKVIRVEFGLNPGETDLILRELI